MILILILAVRVFKRSTEINRVISMVKLLFVNYIKMEYCEQKRSRHTSDRKKVLVHLFSSGKLFAWVHLWSLFHYTVVSISTKPVLSFRVCAFSIFWTIALCIMYCVLNMLPIYWKRNSISSAQMDAGLRHEQSMIAFWLLVSNSVRQFLKTGPCANDFINYCYYNVFSPVNFSKPF